jgi:hypothetical protein
MRKKRKSNVIRKDTSSKAKKVAKIKKAESKRRTAAPKTRNHGTMSEGEFWSFIRSALRNRTRFWRPRLEALKRVRRRYNGPNKRQQWEYKCSSCEGYFPQKNVEVNHIHPAGSLKSGDDLKGFVERLFCEVDGLNVICKPCHKEHHKK